MNRPEVEMAILLQKSVTTVLLVAVLLIPTWIFLAFRSVLHPEGFWQNLATGVVGIVFLGGVQLFLLVLLIVLLFSLWRHEGSIW